MAPILEDKNAVVFLDDPYDYTLYPFNARFPEGPVFAKRLGIADRELMRALPGRSFYLYSVRHLRPYDGPVDGNTTQSNQIESEIIEPEDSP